jgi:hypothetical protein
MQERLERSRQLLASAIAAVRACQDADTQAEVQSALDGAEQQQSGRIRAGTEDAVIEANLNVAENLWDSRLRYCKVPPTAAEKSLSLVMAKLSR